MEDLEFESDIIEDELDSDPLSSSSTSSSPKVTITPSERHALTLSSLNEILAKSAYELRSFTPSYSLLKRLIDETTTPENFELTLDAWRRWRAKGLVIPGEQMMELVRRSQKLRVPAIGVTMLANRDIYGIDIESIAQLNGLFISLSHRSQLEGEKASIEATFEGLLKLLEVTRFVARESGEFMPNVVGNLSTVMFGLKTEHIDSARVTPLLEELKTMGSAEIINYVKANLKRRQTSEMRHKAMSIEETLREAGNADADMFKEVHEGLPEKGNQA